MIAVRAVQPRAVQARLDEPVEKLLTRPGLTAAADIDLVKLASVLPQLLHVREGTELREGRVSVRLASKSGPDFTNPRADHLTPNTDSTLTIGVNWLLNRWVKVVVNGLRQSIDDTTRAPITGTADYWSGLARLQIAF